MDVSSLGFRNQCPMRIEEFKAHQMGQCERIRNLLWTVWVPKCSEVFRRLPPLFINNDSEAYWRSIATLQSNQLRQLVEDSLSAFVGFLESHPAVPEVTGGMWCMRGAMLGGSGWVDLTGQRHIQLTLSRTASTSVA